MIAYGWLNYVAFIIILSCDDFSRWLAEKLSIWLDHASDDFRANETDVSYLILILSMFLCPEL